MCWISDRYFGKLASVSEARSAVIFWEKLEDGKEDVLLGGLMKDNEWDLN